MKNNPKQEFTVGKDEVKAKLLTFRATVDMMKRFERCSDRSQFIRKCVDNAIRYDLDLTEELKSQKAQYVHGEASRSIAFRAPGYMWTFLEAQGEHGRFIRACIQHEMDMENPLDEGVESIERVDYSDEERVNDLAFTEAEIACGIPTAVDSVMAKRSLTELLGIDKDYMYVMRAHGDSMIDAGIASGDMLVIDVRARVPSPDQIAVCELNGEYTLKHCEMHNGYAMLVPENKDFRPIRVLPSDDFHVRGIVHMVLKKY